MEPSQPSFIEYPRSGTPRLGVVFPQTTFFGSAPEMREFTTGVAALGFHHVLAYDHVLGASKATRPDWSGPYSSDDPFQEPFLLFSFMAALAPSLEFATGVIILPQRQTALVAKQAANLDLLSGGTFRLGVGTGWNEVEYEGLNENFTNRGKRFSEQIELIRELTRHDVIDYRGTWHRIDHAGIRPLGIQRPVPIWIGGSAEVAVRRAARIADGFFVNGTAIERCEPSIGVLLDELKRRDRDVSTYGIEVRVSVAKNDQDSWKRDFTHWRERGVSHVSLVTLGANFDQFPQHLERFSEARRIWDAM